LSWRERFDVRRQITDGFPTMPLWILFGLNAVDELDRSVYAILSPEIRESFHLSISGVASVTALVVLIAYPSQILIGYFADRRRRTRIAAGGAAMWGGFTLLTGLAPNVGMLALARASTGIGRAVNDPVHGSLLSDYYPPQTRVRVFGFHQAANRVGAIVAPIIGGGLAFVFGWRAPFLIFWLPTMVLVFVAMRLLTEPVRGEHERLSAGATAETAAIEEEPLSLSEAWRVLFQIKSLRRVWISLPFITVAFLGIAQFLAIFYEEEYNLNEFTRGLIQAFTEPFQLLGLIIGIPIAARLARRGAGRVLFLVAVTGVITAAGLVAVAASPAVGVAIAGHIVVSSVAAMLLPGINSTLSLAIPPRARSMGFGIQGMFIAIGALFLPFIGAVADSVGIRGGILAMAPILLVGAFILASAGSFVDADIERVRSSSLARAEAQAARERGESKLLLVRDLDVGYDGVQVLFGVNAEIDEGEIVALLGTNGAGKSTLLKAISGLVPPIGGSVLFDGAEISGAAPHDIAARGVVQVPGGKGVFTSLTVEENLKIAGWLYHREPDYIAKATEDVLGFFPVLRDRWDQPAGNLSGGEQQMLTLGQAFIARPKLLMIDELSLGLAPVIVEQLLGIVRAIRDRGTTIILVEQSVNVALTVAETAYFMEKGEIRFSGATQELLQRPDILRSVFLEGAAVATNGNGNGNGKSQPAVAKKRSRNGKHAEPILTVDGLSKRYGALTAVNDVTLELREHEILGIIGPNGAGKTTLFDLISGFIPADGGRITFDGRDITDLSPDSRARIGLGRSFQDARLFPALTVRETIALSLERHIDVRDPVAAALHLPEALDAEIATHKRVDELIELLALGAFADKFVTELSTGSRRIVDLACIVAHEPRVILFDEPSSGIAQRETEALGPVLTRIRESTDASLLVIEHDMPLITSISDRLLALDLGAVLVDGLPDEVVRHPEVVSSYLGSAEAVIARSGTAVRAKRARRTTARSTK
jgi:branched-chain amino acid transport system ATP-binding protein